LPLRFFEIDNVVDLDDSAETGAAEYRKVALIEVGPSSGYAAARSTVDSMLRELGWDATYEPIEHPSFVKGRVAQLTVDGKSIGILGEVTPYVFYEKFGLPPCVALAEITLQRIC
jgi:phenylalanyl-tRNA synthetase beta chain